MRKRHSLLLSLFLGVLGLCLPQPLRGQTLTNVTATVIDPSGLPYAGATATFTLVNASGSSSFASQPVAGSTPVPLTISAAFNSSGVLGSTGTGVNIYCNSAGGGCTAISPAGTQWTVTVCALIAVLPVGTQQGCFTSSGITITGATQDISATLNALSLRLTVAANAARVATNDQTLLGANVAATTIFTVPSQGVQRYQVSCYAIVTRAATTSSTLPACNVIFTDADNSTVQTIGLTATNAGNTLTTVTQNNGMINAALGTAVQISTTGYASVGATSMQYALHVKLEILGN